MEKNSSELTNVSESAISKLLKKISNFFRKSNKKNDNTIKKENGYTNNNFNKNSFKNDLSAEYNELQRLNMIREQYEKDEEYIKHISTEDLIKLTEMNNRETQEIENQIKKEKATD